MEQLSGINNIIKTSWNQIDFLMKNELLYSNSKGCFLTNRNPYVLFIAPNKYVQEVIVYHLYIVSVNKVKLDQDIAIRYDINRRLIKFYDDNSCEILRKQFLRQFDGLIQALISRFSKLLIKDYLFYNDYYESKYLSEYASNRLFHDLHFQMKCKSGDSFIKKYRCVDLDNVTNLYNNGLHAIELIRFKYVKDDYADVDRILLWYNKEYRNPIKTVAEESTESPFCLEERLYEPVDNETFGKLLETVEYLVEDNDNLSSILSNLSDNQ